MADLSQMLSQLLSSEEGKNQVNQVLSMLGQGAPATPAPEASAAPVQNPALSSLAAMLQNSAASAPAQPAAAQEGAQQPDLSSLVSMLQNQLGASSAQAPNLPNLDIGKLMKVQQLLSQQRENDSTALLRALKPHLSEKSQKKADEAVRILQLLDLWPLLKESGLLSGLLGGDKA